MKSVTRQRLAALAVLLGTLLPMDAMAQQGYEQQDPAATAAPPAPPPVDPKLEQEVKERFALEPKVAQVQAAALRFFKVHPDRVQAYRRGAAWKALLPNVELIFNNEFGTNDRSLYDYIYYRRMTPPRGDCTSGTCWPAKDEEVTNRMGITLGVRASWALDRLAFNAETLDVSSLVGVQEGLLREITSLYFTRRRLVTALVLSPAQSPHERITENLRLEEITANLDALTGGFFTRESKKNETKTNNPDKW